jgi:ABC-type dipeptide/oligopeptide/nickel transport system ATPase component
MAHRVMVMKDGEIVESGETRSLFASPRHDYTRRLLEAVLE